VAILIVSPSHAGATLADSGIVVRLMHCSVAQDTWFGLIGEVAGMIGSLADRRRRPGLPVNNGGAQGNLVVRVEGLPKAGHRLRWP
jgi:hypothetical protein